MTGNGGRHRREPNPLSDKSLKELPARPDRDTGRPFPPEAPYYIGPELPKDEPRGPMNGTPPRQATPPEGMGRALVWRQDGGKEGVRRYLWSLAVVIVGMTAVILLQYHSFDWVLSWQIWLIVVVGSYLMSDPLARQTISAGADWVQWKKRPKWYQWRRDRGTFLKIYRLTKIEGYGAGPVLYLRIVDEDGRGIDRTRTELHPDRRIWDLMYNGIQHSVANGCEINSLAIQMLHMENSPALRLRESDNEA